jgi:hypothetical protein
MITYTFLQGTKINGLYNRRISASQIELNLTQEQYDYLSKNIFAAHFENGKIVYKNLESIKQKQALEKEQADILQWLADNDWKVNKIVVGEWAKEDPRWIEYLNQRQIKRSRLEQIESML